MSQIITVNDIINFLNAEHAAVNFQVTNGDFQFVLRELLGDSIYVKMNVQEFPADDLITKKMGAKVMLMHATHSSHSANSLLDAEANGCVLGLESYRDLYMSSSYRWRVFAMPPRALMFKVPKYRGFKLRDYEVYKAYDGTVCTLYYDNGQWRMATARLMDATNNSFMSVTYGELLRESLAACPSFVGFDALDKTLSYSIVYTNPRCHAVANHYAVRLIAIMRGTMEDYAETGIPRIERLPEGKSLYDYREANNAAINGSGEPHYGFVFRHKYGNQPDFYLESSLMTFIRRSIYSFTGEEQSKMSTWSVARRRAYVCVRFAIYNRTCEHLLNKWISAWFQEVVECENNIRALISTVHDNIMRNADLNTSPVVMHFTNKLRGTVVNAMNNNTRSTIADMILTGNNIGAILDFVTNI